MKIANDEHGKFTAPGEVRFLRRLPGPIERVWSYLTDSEKRSRWLAAGPMELKVGGKVHLTFQHAALTSHPEPVPAKYQHACGSGNTLTGRVTRCEPPRLLSHTWDEADGTASEVTFELTPQGDAVLLTLTHRKLGDNRALITSVSAGWHSHVAILIAKLENREPPPFWSTHSRLEADYERLLSATA